MNPIELFTNPLQSIALKQLGFDEKSADCLIGATVQNEYGESEVKTYPSWSVITLMKYLPMVIDYNTETEFKLLVKHEYEQLDKNNNTQYFISYITDKNVPIYISKGYSKIDTVCGMLLTLFIEGYPLAKRD